MHQDTYKELHALAMTRSGQDVPKEKSYLMDARLATILRREGFASLDDLAHCLRERPNRVLEEEVIAALTSKETRFFRERNRIAQIVDLILPARLKASSNGSVRVWCAGVGPGQEAYSLLIAFLESPKLKSARIELIGTDLCRASIERARSGVFSHFEIQRGLSVHRMLAHFNKIESGDWQISSELRSKVSFRQHNLLDDASGLGKFDLILCRNVLSGLALAAGSRVADHLNAQLLPGGVIFLGQGESFYGVSEALEPSNTFRGAWVTAGTADLEAEAEAVA